MPFHEKKGGGALDKTGPLMEHFHLSKKKKIEIIFQTNIPSLASSQERWAATKLTNLQYVITPKSKSGPHIIC